MRPILYFAIQRAKAYRKKHGIPDVQRADEKFIQDLYEQNQKRDYDCTTVDPKLLKGLQLRRADLPNCSSWYLKKKGNPEDKILYYIHGGGFVNGSTRQNFSFVSYAVKNFGYDVYSVDYRLTPNHTCIDSITDCEDGYRELLRSYKAENIILMGESAGGNLVLALPQKLKDDSLPLPGGIIASSPVVQFLHYAYSYYENACKTDYAITFGINQVTDFYAGDLPLDHPYLSPLCGDLKDYPPVYLDASDKESLRDEARMMYVRLKEENCDVEYHELKDFFHAQLVDTVHRYVRREEHVHVKEFIRKVFEGRK